MGIEKGIFNRTSLLLGDFNRTSLLLGDDVMDCIYQKRVIIFGLGGVGSWCAESLVRSGIKELVLVDSDRVCVTNVNRQLMATTKTVGQVKVEVLKNRLLEINPHANIVALQDIYEEANTDKFQRSEYGQVPARHIRLHHRRYRQPRKQDAVALARHAHQGNRILVDGSRPQDGPHKNQGRRILEGYRLPARTRTSRQVQAKKIVAQEKSTLRL